jgi:hypothetical protein
MPPYIVKYTISNRTITPPQATEIDVDFSEKVSYKIAIEKGTATIALVGVGMLGIIAMRRYR